MDVSVPSHSFIRTVFHSLHRYLSKLSSTSLRIYQTFCVVIIAVTSDVNSTEKLRKTYSLTTQSQTHEQVFSCETTLTESPSCEYKSLL